MRRGLVAFSALTLFGLGLSGCALNRFEQREPWRDQAEEACLSRKLVSPSEDVVPIKEIDGPGVCGMRQPFRVTRLAGGSVTLKQRMTLACPIIPEVEAWLAGTVQPAAQIYFGQPVVEMNSGSYACRGRNNQVGAKLSEHSFGNAVDVMSFRFADGYVVTVEGRLARHRGRAGLPARGVPRGRATTSPRCWRRGRTSTTTTTCISTSPGTTRAGCAGSASR